MAIHQKIATLAVFVAFIAAVSAFPLEQEVENYKYPKYEFAYGVTDHHTGDIKSQKEERHGDQVTGSYSLAEPSGHILTVHYSADKHSGYQAHVYRDGHPVVPPVLIQPTAFHAPVGHGHGFIKINHLGHW